MEKKLFRVKVVLYVMAENETEARMAATHSKFDIFECTARKADHLEPGWEDAIPYNSDGFKTCGEILSEGQDGLYLDPNFLTNIGRLQESMQSA